MSAEGCSQKDPINVVWMEKAVDNPEMDLATTMEIGGSLKMVTPAGRCLASTSHVGPSDSFPHAPSVEENLQFMVEYLMNLLPPVERLFLNEQRGERRSADVLRSLVHVGQCLISLINSNLSTPMMEKEKIDLLKYKLEHLEKDNAELAKELSFTEEALQEAQESILHRDEELRQAERQIEALEQQKSMADRRIEDLEGWIRILEWQRSKAERDYRWTRDDLEHLKGILEARRDFSCLESRSRRSPDGGPSKRVRIFERTSCGERAPRGDKRFAVKGVQASLELLSGVQEIGSEVEHLKKRLEERKVNHKIL
uniref:Uncharacterized protein LOC105053460 isoform X1 n=1 Tax=Elaeis guineensis var. tenera TaxID=51953 RepID=A0A6J0PNJ9_ELAGV|nr:uncharacterized protein LOC105053460 isoform X1 [Elaeis guineensis]